MPTFNMAKILSFHVKTTSKPFVPPLIMSKNLSTVLTVVDLCSFKRAVMVLNFLWPKNSVGNMGFPNFFFVCLQNVIIFLGIKTTTCCIAKRSLCYVMLSSIEY